MATKGKGTMLTCLLGLKQLDQGVNEKHVWFRLGWLKGPYETNKGTQNETQIAPKCSQIEVEAKPKKHEE